LPTPNTYVTGYTQSATSRRLRGRSTRTFNGVNDAFVAKITDVVLPAQTTGKVTGGGSIDVAGGKGTFGFIVQRKDASSPAKGQLQYIDHASGQKSTAWRLTRS
jgi:hypothetical protein